MTDASGTAKASPKTATTEGELEDKKERPVKEPTVIHDQGFFQHHTGDTYEGNFEAKKKDHSVKMHGPGVYTTAEGDVYSGFWEADKLIGNEVATVTFSDGAKFEGILKDFCYADKGTYIYPDGSVLRAQFAENCPVGNLILIDPNGHTWLGKAENGFGWCEPVNHFYDFLETTHPKIKRRPKVVKEVESVIAPVISPSKPIKTKKGEKK